MKKETSKEILFEGEADEYAQIISRYPISHDDCIAVLKVIAEVKLRTAFSGERMADDIKNLYSKYLR